MGFKNEIETPELLENAKATAKYILEPIREEFGLFAPNSWYRGEELERVICDKAYKDWCKRKGLAVCERSWKSYFELKSHPNAEACDISIVGVPNDELYEWIKANLEFDQLIREFRKEGQPYSGWVHVSYSRTNNRNQAFAIS